jgi:hypothetical protein
VYVPTLDARMNAHHDLFARTANGFWTVKQYLSSFAKDELDRYITTLKAQKPQFYIDPQVEVPAGVPRKTPNPLLTFLREPSSSSASGGLSVLMAEPGQGKTYMSRFLVSTLAEGTSGLVPIMIDSSQWHRLSVDDLGSLWKTITHSFRHFDAPITWLDGHEEQFLRVALKADLIRIVFDGFDEYILRNGGSASPLDVLDALSELAASTGARILITSRTAFWDMSLPEADVHRLQRAGRFFIYRILPFDHEHARNYFIGRLGQAEKVNRATALYGNLKTRDAALVGRGFVLSLIADLVDRSDERRPLLAAEGHALKWLLTALCERETLRQRLPLSGSEQMEMLRQFAVDTALGEAPATATLEYALGITRADLQAADRDLALEKFKSHPLVEKNLTLDRWRFKQEQAQVTLLADYLIQQPEDELTSIAASLHLEGGERQDLAATIVDLVRVGRSEQEARAFVASMISAFAPSTGVSRGAPTLPTDNRRLAAVLLLTAVDRFAPPGSARNERSACLIELAGGEKIAGISFTGAISRFDLRSVKFHACTFEHVTWANCRFDDTTIFDNCDLIGGVAPVHCQGFADVDLSNSRMDYQATAWINSLQIAEGKRSYSADDLKNDMRIVVSKFVNRGGLGLKTLTEGNLAKGPIQSSRYKLEILTELKSTVLDQHDVSGTSEKGFHVRPEAQEAVKFFATNNVFTGPLREAYDHLRSDLRL